MPFSPNAARGEVGTASSGRRTGEAEVEDDDGASGAAVDDGRGRGGGTTSALGVAEIGDDGAVGRRSGMAELGAELGAALRDNDGGEQEAVGAGDGGGTSEAEIKN